MAARDTLHKLKQQERETREDLIIEAARTVFSTRSVDQVSMNEIAKAAGIAKSSIYTYFPNQEALFVETAFRDTAAFIATLKQRIERSSAPTLEGFINDYLETTLRHHAHWRMITHFALHGTVGKVSADKLNHISRQVMDLLEAVIKKIDGRGDTRLLAHTLFAALSGILISFRNYPGRSESVRIAHMRRIAGVVAQMLSALIRQPER